MKIKEIREKTIEELKKEVVDLKKKLLDLRFSKTSNKLEDTASISNTKRDIARIRTVITEKEKEVQNA
ncbi:50S ribosomal protein L29 [bacterium]|nr:50S ribosomal protein L29 [bacterium]